MYAIAHVRERMGYGSHCLEYIDNAQSATQTFGRRMSE